MWVCWLFIVALYQSLYIMQTPVRLIPNMTYTKKTQTSIPEPTCGFGERVCAREGVCRWSLGTFTVCTLDAGVVLMSPWREVLIDSFSPLSFSLTPVPRVACISPGSTAASHVSLFPSCCLTLGGKSGRATSKLRPGSQTEVERDRTDFSELHLLWTSSDTNPLLHFVFTVFAVWCRSIWRREMNWHLTKFSTRKLVSLIFIILKCFLKELDERRLLTCCSAARLSRLKVPVN